MFLIAKIIASNPLYVTDLSQHVPCDYEEHRLIRARRSLDQHVVEVRTQGHRHAGRQRPRRGRPDRHRDGIAVVDGHAEFRRERLWIECIVGHVDGWRDLVLIFDLGLGQRRPAIETPVHRLEPAQHVAAGVDCRQRTNHVRFVLAVQRAVWMLPRAQHTQALEVGALQIDLLERVFAAQPAKFPGIDFLADLADLLLHRNLDRQAMAIPARHVGRAEAGQQLGLDHDVLEDLVDRMAQMNHAIRVRRTVMQDERMLARLRAFLDFAVAVAFFPLGKHARLALGQVAAHGEAGLRQVDGVFVIRAHQDRSSVVNRQSLQAR